MKYDFTNFNFKFKSNQLAEFINFCSKNGNEDWEESKNGECNNYEVSLELKNFDLEKANVVT